MMNSGGVGCIVYLERIASAWNTYSLLIAVRNGDLVLFGDVLDRYGTQFQLEKTYMLIIRLRHNVIKTGVRMISLSYSR